MRENLKNILLIVHQNNSVFNQQSLQKLGGFVSEIKTDAEKINTIYHTTKEEKIFYVDGGVETLTRN